MVVINATSCCYQSLWAHIHLKRSLNLFVFFQGIVERPALLDSESLYPFNQDWIIGKEENIQSFSRAAMFMVVHGNILTQ